MGWDKELPIIPPAPAAPGPAALFIYFNVGDIFIVRLRKAWRSQMKCGASVCTFLHPLVNWIVYIRSHFIGQMIKNINWIIGLNFYRYISNQQAAIHRYGVQEEIVNKHE